MIDRIGSSLRQERPAHSRYWWCLPSSKAIYLVQCKTWHASGRLDHQVSILGLCPSLNQLRHLHHYLHEKSTSILSCNPCLTDNHPHILCILHGCCIRPFLWKSKVLHSNKMWTARNERWLQNTFKWWKPHAAAKRHVRATLGIHFWSWVIHNQNDCRGIELKISGVI